MAVTKICVILITAVLHCNGIDIFEQLDHITQKQADNRNGIPRIMRRFQGESVILGSPRDNHHLPVADAILPGHTLIKPAVGMLKSAVKFPHREQENGGGVYGHIDNLGIKYGGKKERVWYSGFRRSLPGSQPGQLQPKRNNKMINAKERRKPLWSGLENEKNEKHTTRYQQHEPNSYLIIIMKNRDKQDRLKNLQQKRDAAVAKAEASEGDDLEDFLRIIKSLRRDQELRIAEKRPKTYIPGRVGLGSFVITQADSNEGELNKTKLFWETQDAFNHIKVNPEAPEHSDLLPDESAENTRNWWFYNQMDFEEFEDR